MLSIKEILETAIQRVKDEHGVVIKILRVTYTDITSLRNQDYAVKTIEVEDSILIQPVKL